MSTAEDEFISKTFKILSSDVIIQVIMAKMDVMVIVGLCSSNRRFREFCNSHSDRIWKMLLRRDFPHFGIMGYAKEHYIKIFTGIGETYHFFENIFNPNIIRPNSEPEKQAIFGKSTGTFPSFMFPIEFTVIGNPKPKNSIVTVVSLFNPEKLKGVGEAFLSYNDAIGFLQNLKIKGFIVNDDQELTPELGNPVFVWKKSNVLAQRGLRTNFVENPNTGSLIKVGGRLYKQLIQEGVEFPDVEPEVSEPKSLIEISINNILTGGRNYIVIFEVILPEQVFE